MDIRSSELSIYMSIKMNCCRFLFNDLFLQHKFQTFMKLVYDILAQISMLACKILNKALLQKLICEHFLVLDQ